MQNINAKQKSLVKAQRATRVIAWLLICGGGVLFVNGLVQQVLLSLTYGIVLMIGSLPLFVLAKIAKKKLDQLGI